MFGRKGMAVSVRLPKLIKILDASFSQLCFQRDLSINNFYVGGSPTNLSNLRATDVDKTTGRRYYLSWYFDKNFRELCVHLFYYGLNGDLVRIAYAFNESYLVMKGFKDYMDFLLSFSVVGSLNSKRFLFEKFVGTPEWVN